MNKMFKFIFIILCFWCTYFLQITCDEISDKRLCADPKCEVVISHATTLLNYPSNNPYILSLPINVEVKIYSKSAGQNSNLWGVEYKDKRGYIPKRVVRETKVFVRKLDYLVDTEFVNNKPSGSIDPIKTAPVDDKVIDIKSTAPNVIHGTTFYYGLENDSSEIVNNVPNDKLTNLNKQNNFDVDDGIKVELEDIGLNAENENTNTENIVSESITINQPNSESQENVIDKQIETDQSTNSENDLNNNEVTTEIPTIDQSEDRLNNTNLNNNEINTEIPATIEPKIDQQEINLNNMNLNLNNNELTTEIPVTLSETIELTIDQPEVNLNNIEVNNNEVTTEIPFTKTIEPKFDQQEGNLNNVNLNLNNNEVTTKISETIEPKFDQQEGSLNNVNLNLNNNEVTTEIPSTLSATIEPKIEQQEASSNNIELNNNEVMTEIPMTQSEDKEQKAFEPATINVESFKKEEKADVIDSSSENTNPTTNNDPVILESMKTMTESVPNVNVDIDSHFTTENPINGQVNSEDSLPDLKENIQEAPVIKQDDVDVPISNENIMQPIINENIQQKQNEDTVSNLNKLNSLLTRKPYVLNNIQVKPQQNMMFENTLTEPEVNIGNSFVREPIKIEKETLPNEIKPEDIAAIDTIDEHSTIDNMPNSNELNNVEETVKDIVNNEPSIVDDIVPDEINSEVPNELTEMTFMDTVYSFLGLSNSVDNAHPTDCLEDNSDTSESVFNVYKKDKSDPEICRSYNHDAHQCADDDRKTLLPSSVDLSNSLFGITFLCITALTVLLFTLGYYFIEKRNRDGAYVKEINELKKNLLVSRKECDGLRTILESKQDNVIDSEIIEQLNLEIANLNANIAELEEQNANLEKELESATEAGLEVNSILTDFLSSQNRNDCLEENIDTLQKRLNEQQNIINDMNSVIEKQNYDKDCLQSQFLEVNERNEQLQTSVNELLSNVAQMNKVMAEKEIELQEENNDLQRQLKNVIQTMTNDSNSLKENLNSVQAKLKHVESQLEIKNTELSLLQEGISDGDTNVSKNIVEVSHIKAELHHVTNDNKKLIDSLSNEKETRKQMDNEMKQMRSDVVLLRTKLEEAENDKAEAITKLEVLSSYFKDKEAQLQKEKMKLEEIWLQNQGDANSTTERLKLMQEEIQNHKLQNEMLQKEIMDQEVSLKSQISILEKKLRESWLTSRQIERKLEDSKQEASQLRNRLTIVEKSLCNQQTDDSKAQYRVFSPTEDMHNQSQHDAVISPSLFPHDAPSSLPLPPFLGLPPPPPPGAPFAPPFMPPPPNLYQGDRRPPPLGRMSSPPLNSNTFSPTRTFSPYNRDDTSSMSPPIPPYETLDAPYPEVDGFRPPYNNARDNWEDQHQAWHTPSKKSTRLKQKNDV